jgi:UDP-3-O-[3-hydroxymyristoyl] glucosamine N-acyltransferase
MTQIPQNLSLQLVEQHKRRLCHMPWLYFRLKPAQLEWAIPWQAEIHKSISQFEDIDIDPSSFIADDARLFAERGRKITVGPLSHVGAGSFLHGPIQIGAHVGINHSVSIDC